MKTVKPRKQYTEFFQDNHNDSELSNLSHEAKDKIKQLIIEAQAVGIETALNMASEQAVVFGGGLVKQSITNLKERLFKTIDFDRKQILNYEQKFYSQVLEDAKGINYLDAEIKNCTIKNYRNVTFIGCYLKNVDFVDCHGIEFLNCVYQEIAGSNVNARWNIKG